MKLRQIVTWFALFAATSGVAIGLGLDQPAVPASAANNAVSIEIIPAVPRELNPARGGAQQANIMQAAAFSWQEFIALNWPAVNQNGMPGQRDQADVRCKFADPKCADRPLVWHTFRGKVEIFPGQGLPPGYQTQDASFGYDALPSYVYAQAVPACSGAAAGTPWINLDETDQITLDSMYAGAAPPSLANNSAPQLIRFMAKASRTHYAYVAKNKWWSTIDATVLINTRAYLGKNFASPPAGSSTLVSLPNNTIEVKAGWRALTQAEVKSGRFHTTRVRFYEPKKSGGACYNDDEWGLVALHIIQKTPTAPHFIFATFEQADNILTSDGKPVEDADGAVQIQPACRADQVAPCPTTPSVTLVDPAAVAASGVPPQVVLVPANAQYCTASPAIRPRGQLYYQNTSSKTALPRAGYICVNKRDYDIPAPIIAANKTAHAAIQRYNQAQGIQRSPWLYYKLVNVQYQPIDKNYVGPYTGNDPNSGRNPSSYHQANIVVETNRSLQVFSGGLVQSGYTGANSDNQSQFARGGTGIHRNTYYDGKPYNMGGCMGCHGSQGQQQGADFSVILANGKVMNPEFPAPNTPAGTGTVVRNRLLKSGH